MDVCGYIKDGNGNIMQSCNISRNDMRYQAVRSKTHTTRETRGTPMRQQASLKSQSPVVSL